MTEQSPVYLAVEEMFAFVNKELEKEDKTWRIYFDGEGDSNQTKFERLSNHLKIAVIAPNEQLAAFYLRLLRCVVDEHVGMLELVMDYRPLAHSGR